MLISAFRWANVNIIWTISIKFVYWKVPFNSLIKYSSSLPFNSSNSQKYIFFSFTTLKRISLYSCSVQLASDNVIWLESTSFWIRRWKSFSHTLAISAIFIGLKWPYLLGLSILNIVQNKKLMDCLKLSGCNILSVIFPFCFNAGNS